MRRLSTAGLVVCSSLLAIPGCGSSHVDGDAAAPAAEWEWHVGVQLDTAARRLVLHGGDLRYTREGRLYVAPRFYAMDDFGFGAVKSAWPDSAAVRASALIALDSGGKPLGARYFTDLADFTFGDYAVDGSGVAFTIDGPDSQDGKPATTPRLSGWSPEGGVIHLSSADDPELTPVWAMSPSRLWVATFGNATDGFLFHGAPVPRAASESATIVVGYDAKEAVRFVRRLPAKAGATSRFVQNVMATDAGDSYLLVASTLSDEKAALDAIRIGSNGDVLWEAPVEAACAFIPAIDVAHDVAVDGQGNVHVVSACLDPSAPLDAARLYREYVLDPSGHRTSASDLLMFDAGQVGHLAGAHIMGDGGVVFFGEYGSDTRLPFDAPSVKGSTDGFVVRYAAGKLAGSVTVNGPLTDIVLGAAQSPTSGALGFATLSIDSAASGVQAGDFSIHQTILGNVP